MPSFKGSSKAKNQTYVSYVSCIGRQVLFHWCHLGNPLICLKCLFCVIMVLNYITMKVNMYEEERNLIGEAEQT